MKSRKNWILILLPPLAIAGVYWWSFFSRTQNQLKSLQEKVEQLTNLVGNYRNTLEEKKKETEILAQEVSKIEKEVQDVELEISRFQDSYHEANLMETVVLLTKLLKDHRILLLESVFESQYTQNFFEESKDSKLKESSFLQKPPVLLYYENQFKQIREDSGFLLKLEFLGAFLDVHEFMTQISQLHIRAFPVSLKMKRMGNGNIQRWYLVVWI
jgi:hypothetical protein